MKRQQLKIGDFAKLAHVSVQTLRHYAQRGLFSPSVVDEASGYRYYALEQLTQFHHIQALKDLGLSLEQIQTLLEEGVTEQDLRAMLRLKQTELKTQLQAQQEQLHRVEARLNLLTQEAPAPLANIVLKSVAAQQGITARGKLSQFKDITNLFLKLDNHMEHYRASPAGPCFAVTEQPELRLKNNAYRVQVVTPVYTALPDTSEVTCQRLEAIPLVASLLHYGSYDTLADSYQKLFAWLGVNGYSVIGASREVYLRMSDIAKLYPDVYLTKHPDEYLTEILLPVAKIHEA